MKLSNHIVFSHNFSILNQEPQKNKQNSTKNFSIPAFQGIIPQKQIKKLNNEYIKKISNVNNEDSFFSIAGEYFRTHLLSLIAGRPEHNQNDNALLRLFRHELINNIGAKFELELNPALKDYITKDSNENSYISHQHKNFRQILHTVREMVGMWGKIESWKLHPNKTIPFPEILKTLKKAAKFGNHNNTNIEFISDINTESLVTRNAFDQYNILSQIILNSIKYSESNPVTVRFSKTEAHNALGKEVYTMTVTNHGTKPIKNEDIEKILDGNGHRTGDRNIDGTGLGYKEIIAILRKYYGDAKGLDLIEKDRTSGVKVTVPFKLYENNKK